ncbi:hypothetical protein HDU93_004089 [Gonapodya sp. JEL0774]|nr:hypothetical protein HDU93_004089 [Gonapodya sp. JEL0774]
MALSHTEIATDYLANLAKDLDKSLSYLSKDLKYQFAPASLHMPVLGYDAMAGMMKGFFKSFAVEVTDSFESADGRKVCLSVGIILGRVMSSGVMCDVTLFTILVQFLGN